MEINGALNRPRRSWPLLVALVELVAVVASECGTSATGAGLGAEGPPALRTDVREPAALGTLRQLDPCALLDPVAARAAGRIRMWAGRRRTRAPPTPAA